MEKDSLPFFYILYIQSFPTMNLRAWAITKFSYKYDRALSYLSLHFRNQKLINFIYKNLSYSICAYKQWNHHYIGFEDDPKIKRGFSK